MDLKDKTIMILGGSGLVGRAVVQQLLPHGPAKIILVALYEREVRDVADAFDGSRGTTEFAVEWGDVFLPAEVARRPRRDALEDDALRQMVIRSVLDDFDEAVLQESFLFQVLDKYKPNAVVDCINTATALAYQDVHASARELLALAEDGAVTREAVERHVLTLTMPQLIRHIQIATEAMARVGTDAYVKIGTSGTGGMGLNIPYTHSEERPSRQLLTKAAVAGAHSIMLFLIGRTPGAPSAHEIKPTAAIAWREIAHGPIRRSGRPLRRFDCPKPLPLDRAFEQDAEGWTDTGKPVESVFIDVGENGVFARDEFETVTSMGQMEYITPEEVANYVVMELRGRTTGKDVVAALDSATSGPTYTAGVLRAAALDRLDKLELRYGVRSVAFEMLGPPRLTKMLYEAHVFSQLRPSVRALAESDAATLAMEASGLLEADGDLRSLIISVGMPILLDDGRVYRGASVLLPPNGADLEASADRGWVDLRTERCARWIDRSQRMVAQAEARAAADPGSGSSVDWHAMGPDDKIAPAQFAKWVFRYEDDGERIKR